MSKTLRTSWIHLILPLILICLKSYYIGLYSLQILSFDSPNLLGYYNLRKGKKSATDLSGKRSLSLFFPVNYKVIKLMKLCGALEVTVFYVDTEKHH